MKQSLMKYAVLALLLTCAITACKKNALQPAGNLNEAASVAATTTVCQYCDAKAAANDLSPVLQTYNFKEGNNVVSSQPDGTKLIALVQSGRIAKWVLETKSGRQLLPQSTEMTARKINRFGNGLNIYRICFYLDGLYNCWLVIKI